MGAKTKVFVFLFDVFHNSPAGLGKSCKFNGMAKGRNDLNVGWPQVRKKWGVYLKYSCFFSFS